MSTANKSANSSSALLCQPSNGQESDWSKLYETAFPQDERMPLADVQAMISNNTMLLHRTTNAAGELLCFSLVTPMSNFTLLAYIATDQTKRSSGVGSKHMKELIQVLKASYHQTQIGLFLEIESTKEANLSVDETTMRKRRLAFYQRLHCKRLCGKDYFLPSYAAGVAHRHGELLWYEFGAAVDKDSTVAQVIAEIYTRGYGISSSHATYVQVLSQFNLAATAAGDYDSLCPTQNANPVVVAPAVVAPAVVAPVAAAPAAAAPVSSAPVAIAPITPAEIPSIAAPDVK
ncbi:MAG: hypothetical protein WC028_28580 [Candidatus Obscuribacterales bacterium]